MLNLIIAGDFCPIREAERLLSEGGSVIHPDFEKLWLSADFRIANLECPVTTYNKGIRKSGPLMKCSPDIKNGLSQFNFNAVSLANNHIMDYGIEGFKETCSVLEQEGIKYFGVKKNHESHQYVIFEKEGIKVGITSYSIAEFCLADDFNGNGAEKIHLIKILKDLGELQSKVDHIVVLLHMGLNMLQLPSPNQAEICRFLATQPKVKAVLCQHSHITGCFENVNGCFISYGQGSFLFDMNKKKSHWNKGYVVSLKFTQDSAKTQITGTVQFDEEPMIRLMTAAEQNEMMKVIENLNNFLKEESLIRKKFVESVIKKRNNYYGMMMLPEGRYFSALRRRVNLGRFIPSSIKLTLLNFFRNEEHAEAIQEILKSDTK